MPIPNYGLVDENGNHVLSRDKQFRHMWYSSSKLRIYDNDTYEQMASDAILPPTTTTGNRTVAVGIINFPPSKDEGFFPL
jgi:hypothetical protein